MINNVYFTADTHFGSERTLNLSLRPFPSVHDMNRELVNNWNSIVSDNDVVFHLGDFGDYNFAKLLNGKIILVKGNYDKDIPPNLFHRVYDYLILPDLFGNNKPVLLIHKPTDAYNLDKPFHFVLFGHIHKLQLVKKNGINVGVDCHNYMPVGLENLKLLYDGIKQHYDNDVFDQLDREKGGLLHYFKGDTARKL